MSGIGLGTAWAMLERSQRLLKKITEGDEELKVRLERNQEKATQ